jgi:gamma-glutamyl-gamma-aminobutyrate hydrolase PuuD
MNPTAPVIGIPATVLGDKTVGLPGTVNTYVGQDYLDAVRAAGGHPVVLPIAGAAEAAARRLDAFHHQAVKDLGPGLRVSARAWDGVVEGVETTDGSFMLGVQCHPEAMVAQHPDMQRLFRALVAACGTKRSASSSI